MCPLARPPPKFYPHANFAVQIDDTSHKLGWKMHRTLCFTPCCPEIPNESSGAVSIISTNISQTSGPGSNINPKTNTGNPPKGVYHRGSDYLRSSALAPRTDPLQPYTLQQA
ncbi:hypothetical protein N7501_005270 [Penicillium viridicatum]|nr:hypothetical protein N7501_005270 [Penicillium viridicatum]